jgi:hypothetical protein
MVWGSPAAHVNVFDDPLLFFQDHHYHHHFTPTTSAVTPAQLTAYQGTENGQAASQAPNKNLASEGIP